MATFVAAFIFPKNEKCQESKGACLLFHSSAHNERRAIISCGANHRRLSFIRSRALSFWFIGGFSAPNSWTSRSGGGKGPAIFRCLRPTQVPPRGDLLLFVYANFIEIDLGVCGMEWNGSRSMDCVETSRVEAEASHPISAGSIVSLSSGADGVDWPLFVSIRRADSSRPLVKFPWNWLDLPVPPEDFSVCTLALFFRRNFARRLASVRQLDCSRNGFVCYSFDWVCAVQLISIFFQRKSLCLSAP